MSPSKTLPIDESMTADQLAAVVDDHLVLISYDGGTKFGIVGEDRRGSEFPIRLLASRNGPLTNNWERMDRHHFVVLGEWREPDPEPLAITEDLTEAALAEVAFTEEVVVMWEVDRGVSRKPLVSGENRYGIITGYEPPAGGESEGLFIVELVKAPGNAEGDWVETGKAVQMRRSDFLVFGPANRDPEVRPATPPARQPRPYSDELGWLDEDFRLKQFVVAVQDLVRIGMGDFCSNEPAFRVRLDIGVDKDKGYSRTYRILVRPVMDPMMHPEIEALLKIASAHELSLFAADGTPGLELRAPDDSV